MCFDWLIDWLIHLRRLRQIRRLVGTEVTIRLVLALITSRLDYCNSLLAGAPQSTLGVLQRVQNAAARLIFELGLCDHVTDSLIQLHWLPIRWRVQYKLVMLMHGTVVGTCPEYLRTIVEPATPSHPGLRRTASTHQVQLLRPGCIKLTACRHPVHDEQTNFQNITEISFLSSSFWYFIVTANCLLLGAHVLIVMGALQIYIDDDDDDSGYTHVFMYIFYSPKW